jgi:hypothetical protein
MNPLSSLFCSFGRIEDLLGRVPLFPSFLDGNTTSTIPYKYAAQQKQAFEFGCADGQGPASRRGGHVYENNNWLWNFGRPQPRVKYCSLSISLCTSLYAYIPVCTHTYQSMTILSLYIRVHTSNVSSQMALQQKAEGPLGFKQN